jgi:hypothetical protein
MARSKIAAPTNDPISDSGAVLWSMVLGEQLEYPVDVTFIDDAEDYNYVAYVIEAENVADQEEKPTDYKSGGVVTSLTVRVPVNQGTWDAATAYNAEDIVEYLGKWYVLTEGSAYISSTIPTEDDLWEKTVPNRVWVRIPETFATDWEIAPGPNYHTYGFFELLVREPSGLFPKKWKPTRGMVEVHFSPIKIAVP